MRRSFRTEWRLILSVLVALACISMPAMAQEQSAPDPADSVAGSIFRWLNFAIVAFGITYVIRKAGAPYFRQNAKAISQSIHQAAEARAAAEREMKAIDEKLAHIDREIAEMRKAGVGEIAAQAERIRALTQSEVERVGQAARSEIIASERAAAQELRAAAARLATQHAAGLVRSRVNPAAEAGLFKSFLVEVEKSAS